MFADLYRSFFTVCSNTIIPHKKLVTAIVAVHHGKPCLFTPNLVLIEAAVISQTIRIGASKWRQMAQFEQYRRVIMDKVIMDV